MSDPWIVKTNAQTRHEIEALKVVSKSDLNKAQNLGVTLMEALKLGMY